MSFEVLDQSSDDQIWAALIPILLCRLPCEHDVHAWICDGCGEEDEELCGDYKFCSKCKRAHYCSRDCQVKHWKLHQRDCKVNRTKKLFLALIKDVKTMCKSTIRNYVDVMKSAGCEEISKEQRNVLAFLGMVQLTRKFILDHTSLDPDKAFGSTTSDLDFRKQIDAFIVSQEGFPLNDPRLYHIPDDQRLTLIATEEAEFYKDPLLEKIQGAAAALFAPTLCKFNISPDYQRQKLAFQHVVATVETFLANTRPETFSPPFQDGSKIVEVITTAMYEYFYILAEFSS